MAMDSYQTPYGRDRTQEDFTLIYDMMKDGGLQGMRNDPSSISSSSSDSIWESTSEPVSSWSAETVRKRRRKLDAVQRERSLKEMLVGVQEAALDKMQVMDAEIDELKMRNRKLEFEDGIMLGKIRLMQENLMGEISKKETIASNLNFTGLRI